MDFPKETEIITSPDYTLRFNPSDETQSVQVSIDDGPWQECRKADGHFWFDWAHYASGRHAIAARAILANGQTEETGARIIRVKLEQNEK
jgi:hypothetical protein